jgi:hypothetical protein
VTISIGRIEISCGVDTDKSWIVSGCCEGGNKSSRSNLADIAVIVVCGIEIS